MSHYDPEIAPAPKDWLALDEGERISAVKNFHVASRIKLPDAIAHATFHTIVENQIAEGFEPSKRAVARLQSEGLSRHDAIHAIASVIVKFYHDSTKSQSVEKPGAEQTQAQLSDAIENLSARNGFVNQV